MKTVLKLATIFLALPFLSCDPGTCETDFIENQSSGVVYLYHTDSVTVDTVYAGRGIDFAPICGCCGSGGGMQPTHAFQFYIYARNADTLCKKDIRNPEDWNTVKIENRKWEHRFTITDADFK